MYALNASDNKWKLINTTTLSYGNHDDTDGTHDIGYTKEYLFLWKFWVACSSSERI